MTKKTRSTETIVEISAEPASVWRALTEGEELARWFAFEARSKPGKDGSIFLSWGPDCEGEGSIEVWEPEHHLRVRDEVIDMSQDDHPDGPVGLATDYYLEGKGGTTTLRVVTSGFGTDASWDDQYDSVSRGWEVFLRGLAWYVERHFGTPRMLVFAEAKYGCSMEEAWQRLVGVEGLTAKGSFDGLDEGDAVRIETASGDELSGVVDVANPPKDLAVIVENLNDAHLWVEVTSWNEAKLTLSTYGVPQGIVTLTKQKWQSMLDRLFPAHEQQLTKG